MKKENIKYYFLIIFFCLILFLSPISGDDWSNYLEGSLGIKHMFTQAIGMYFDWESRIVSRILINFLTFYKPIWNILNSILIVGIIYFIMKIIKPKNKKMIFLMSLLVILGMNIFTFSQVVVWIAGNITYLFVIPILLFYFYTIYNHKSSRNQTIFFSILNILVPLFVDHIGVILVLGNLLIIIYQYYKTKTINKALISYLICSIIGMLFVILSPGSMKRNAVENIEFNKLNLFEKINYNLPNFIYYTYITNTYLIILMSIGISSLLKSVKNKPIKILGNIYLIPAVIISIIYLFENIKGITIIKPNNILIIIYFIIYSVISFILLIINIKKEPYQKITFLYLLGIASNLVMLISPTWGFRTGFATYIFLSIAYLYIIDLNIKENKLINNFLLIISIGAICFYSILYVNVRRQNIDNVKNIELQKKEKAKVIEIVKYPHFANCNINPENEYHIEKFKQYYKIDSDVEIKLIDNNWKYLIFYYK